MVVGARQTSRAASTAMETTVPFPATSTLKLDIGRRAITTTRKMMVRLASRMLSAISLGVFWRLAPSTMAIIRSRKVSPGSVVTRTISQSESTRVPPVTALRSPPLSRMTGALSPVMALSSTEAAPTMTSPSAGINSPASTSTMSPRLRRPETTLSAPAPRSGADSLWASTSWRAFRKVSACARPRPSARASAKLAKTTVNHRSRDMARVNPLEPSAMPARDSKNSTKVRKAPTHTTNITGLRTCTRGSSLRNEFATASTIIRRS